MDDSAFGGSTPPGTMAGGNTDFGSALSLAPPPAVPDAPAPQPAPSAPQGGIFGSGIGAGFGGANYKPPDPQASALDQTADLLQQRVARANAVASNPILQFFNPEGVQAARNFVPAATEQLQKIRQQKADMQANRTQAATLGLDPGEVPDEATQADRVAVAQSKALQGNLQVFKGLQAVDPKSAEAIQDQVHEAAAGHLTNAQFAFDKLSNMTNQGEYTAAIKSLRQDGTLSQLEGMGMKVPDDFNQFNAAKAREGQALREARIGIDTLRQKLEDRNTYQPMEEKEANTYKGRVTTAYGDQVTNGTWSRNGASGTRGLVVNGMADPRKLGQDFTLGTDEQRKAMRDEAAVEVTKPEIEKNRAFARTYQLATTDSKGNPIPPDAKNPLNTNPNVQQGIAEGLASMLRGGGGGATAGLLKIESGKRAYTQSLLDTIAANYAGGINALSGGADPEKVKPYLTQLTQNQQRQVLDTLKAYNDQTVGSRIGRTAERAGALGFDASVFGYGKGENGEIDDAIERGHDAQVTRMMPNHQAIGGGDGVLQLGAQRPGAGATNVPPGTATTAQLPGAQPLQTPVQQASIAPGVPSQGTPPAGPASTSPAGSGPAGGGSPPAPVTIAGQPVSFTPPPGVTPAYLTSTQRIESGGSKNPWTATTPGSSASGAFQMIDSTWAANKPPGAPARAKDATPQQQTQAMEKFTAANAASLQSAGLPVNDANLYVAHNLGATGAAALLHADPNADARSIVGEAAARNNPMFFKGRPTAATVLQRYQAEMGKGAPSSSAPDRTATLPDVGAAPWTGRTTPAGDHVATPAERAAGPVVSNAPAIASTAGTLGGMLAGGPFGGMAGGGAGGAAGQAFKDYMQGREQDPAKITKQAALGAVLGIAPEASPVLGAAARVGGVAAVNAGATALQGGDASDIAGSAAEGAGYALGGEALGRFVSMGGSAAYKALSRYTTGAQADLSASAGKLAEARATMASEPPKLPGDAGANPKYEAAKQAADDATAAIKDHGQNPDDMVHAYEQAKAGVPSGEAQVMKGAASERRAVSAGYNDLRTQVADTGVGAVKPNQAIPDGPTAQLRTADNPTGKVPEQFRPEAEHAEMLVKAPAKDWGEKWKQLQDAGSELIQKRLSFLQNADKPSADAMDGLFQGVRNQQKAAAAYVFGPERGAKIIENLQNLDQRYAKVMNATQGMNYGKMQSVLAQGNTPAARELQKNFTEFAKGDPSALRAFNAMKAGAKGDWKSEAALMGPVIAGEVAANLHGVPTVGMISALVGGQRLYKLVQGYMNARVLGKAVMFKDFLANEVKSGLPQAAQTAAQRGATMQ
jgi:hypothetical protein